MVLQLTVDHIDDLTSFLNTYKTTISQLWLANINALGDAVVMKALIIHSFTCEKYHSVMVDLSKN
jgi:hypothetical protein